MHLKLAVLLCDELILKSPITRATYGQYSKIFRRFLDESLKQVNPDATFTLDDYDVFEKMEYPPDSTHYDGLLISGSLASTYEDRPWIHKLIEYVKRILVEKPSLKIFGICFGHQIVATALGSKVEPRSWELSVTNIELTRIGKAIFHSPELHLQEFHHDQVSTRLHNAHLVGSSHSTRSQGLVTFHPELAPSAEDLESNQPRVHLRSIHVLTFQGHPEFTESIVRQLLIEHVDDLGQELVDDALKRVGLPTDGIGKVGRVIWGVLGVRAHHDSESNC
ncbi:class I glutamine amidotransferase-like protein [Boletus coccyginus]|nr:class I glutamine amidotransferase-like protein [Boletus coccyginus]